MKKFDAEITRSGARQVEVQARGKSDLVYGCHITHCRAASTPPRRFFLRERRNEKRNCVHSKEYLADPDRILNVLANDAQNGSLFFVSAGKLSAVQHVELTAAAL